MNLVLYADISNSEAITKFTLANEKYSKAHKLMSQKKLKSSIELFKESSDKYEELIDSNYINGQIYYNLANAYYRQGKPGKAVLFYNKSLKLMPRNSELKENLNLVKSEFEDKESRNKIPSILKSIFFWYFLFNLNESTIFALSFFILFMICVTIFIFKRLQWIKSLCIGFGIALIVTSLSFFVKFYSEEVSIKGFVINNECDVKYGPGDEYETKFIIHEGAKFLVKEDLENWYKVYVYVEVKLNESDDETESKEYKIGWVTKENVGLI